MGELDDLRKKAEKKNHEDQMLAKKYNGDVKYMRTHKRIMESPPPIADAVTIHKILMDVKIMRMIRLLIMRVCLITKRTLSKHCSLLLSMRAKHRRRK